MLLSAGDTFSLTIVCQQDILQLQKSARKNKQDFNTYSNTIKKSSVAFYYQQL